MKLLTVAVDRLNAMVQAGLLCIGDAAHAMSPIGGVGINLAVQDAVAAANILASRCASGAATPSICARCRSAATLPTRVTQRMQVLMQHHIITRVLAAPSELEAAVALRLSTGFRSCAAFRRASRASASAPSNPDAGAREAGEDVGQENACG